MKRLQIFALCFSVFYLCFRIFTPIETLKTTPEKQHLNKEIKQVKNPILQKYGKIITENK